MQRPLLYYCPLLRPRKRFTTRREAGCATPAEHANYENLMVLDDPDVVGRFQQEFRRLWREGKE